MHSTTDIIAMALYALCKDKSLNVCVIIIIIMVQGSGGGGEDKWGSSAERWSPETGPAVGGSPPGTG